MVNYHESFILISAFPSSIAPREGKPILASTFGLLISTSIFGPLISTPGNPIPASIFGPWIFNSGLGIEGPLISIPPPILGPLISNPASILGPLISTPGNPIPASIFGPLISTPGKSTLEFSLYLFQHQF